MTCDSRRFLGWIARDWQQPFGKSRSSAADPSFGELWIPIGQAKSISVGRRSPSATQVPHSRIVLPISNSVLTLSLVESSPPPSGKTSIVLFVLFRERIVRAALLADGLWVMSGWCGCGIINSFPHGGIMERKDWSIEARLSQLERFEKARYRRHKCFWERLYWALAIAVTLIVVASSARLI